MSLEGDPASDSRPLEDNVEAENETSVHAPLTQKERLSQLRARLRLARAENVDAVAREGYQAAAVSEGGDSGDSGENRSHMTAAIANDSSTPLSSVRLIRKRRRSHRGGGREANEEAYTKSMRIRIARMQKDATNRGEVRGMCDKRDESLTYGGKVRVDSRAAERLADELDDHERRKVRYRSQKAFDEDKEDIGFINDQNQKFNKILNHHYDKFESVREVKESLERGTALP